jgi:hypothetical protein
VTALFTFVTAIATGVIAYYSYQSWHILKRQEENDRKRLQPVLVFINEVVISEQGGATQELLVKNVGYGPAIDIVRNITQVGSKWMKHYDPREALLLGSLGPGDKARAYFTTPEVPIIDDPEFKAVLEYSDLLGNHYETSYQQRHHSGQVQIVERKIPWDKVQRI